jgi:probable HAF family extracellular repeat protein
VTGYARTHQGDLHAALWTGGSVIDLTAGVAGASYGWSLNNAGHVVGLITTGFSTSHAFLWDGALHDLNSLIPLNSGWTLTDARDINDAGQIVGNGWNPEGHFRAFILTPVPEPATYAMLLAGLGLLAGIRGRVMRSGTRP